MTADTVFDYFYGDESTMFSFYRIPRQLVVGEQFRKLSTDAKLLYGLFLDRVGLSAKNGWYDEQGRVYIYYTINEIREDLNCGNDKAIKLLAELDSAKGFGLIERVKQGQGRPAKIYVKRFTTGKMPEKKPKPEKNIRPRQSGNQDVGKAELQTSDFPTSRNRFSRLQDIGKPDSNYIDISYTEKSQNNQSFIQSGKQSSKQSAAEQRNACRREIEDRIYYNILCEEFSRDDVDEITELITDTLCSTAKEIYIGREAIAAEQVKNRFAKLNFAHLEYVFHCLYQNSTDIRNIKAYLLTVLYNAPTTISNYYRSAVQRDFDP